MKNSPILFIDCETLGLKEDSPIWEVAWMLIDGYDNLLTHDSVLVEHDPDLMDPDLPQPFFDDYSVRYIPQEAMTHTRLTERLARVVAMTSERPIVAGSNPWFDMHKISQLDGAEKITWHYHPMDIPTLVHGYLLGKGISPAPPWKSDFLSQAVGIDVRNFDRHTAMGDVRWTYALWRKVFGR